MRKNREILFIIKLRNDARKALRGFGQDLGKVGAGGKKAGDGLKKTRDQADKLGKGLKQPVLSLERLRNVLLSIGIGIGFGAIVRTISSFSEEMKTVQAVTGATGAEFKRLNARAKELGATTRFTATDAAQGLKFLARAGLSTGEAMEAVGDTLLLAQAGALGLADAARITSNVLRAFELDVSQTARIADTLVTTSIRANTSVQELGEAFKFVGSVAVGFNVDLETVSAALGTLADSGLKATLGGTGLRRILSTLAKSTKKLSPELELLGLTTEDVDVKVLGLVQVLKNLRKAGLDTGDALVVFGERGGPALNILTRQIPRLEKLFAEIKAGGGDSQRVADIMDESVKGALLAVASAFESIVLSLEDVGGFKVIIGLANALTGVLRLLSSAISGLGGLFPDFDDDLSFTSKLVEVFMLLIVGLIALLGAKLLGPMVRAGIGFLGLGAKATAASVGVSKLRLGLGLLKNAFKIGAFIGLAVEFGNLTAKVTQLDKELRGTASTLTILRAGFVNLFSPEAAKAILAGPVAAVKELQAFGPEFVNAIAGATDQVQDAIKKILDGTVIGDRDLLARFQAIGVKIPQAVIDGLRNAKAGTKISEVFAALGIDAGEFFAKGVAQKINDAIKAAEAEEIANRTPFRKLVGEDFGNLTKFREVVGGLVGAIDPLLAKERERAEQLKIINILQKATNAELKVSGLTRQELTRLIAKFNAEGEKEVGTVAKRLKSADAELRVLQEVLKAGGELSVRRKAELEALKVIAAAKKNNEPLDQSEIELLKSKFRNIARLTKQINAETAARKKRAAFQESFANDIAAINLETRLIGVGNRERERTLEILKLRQKAQKDGITNVEELVAKLKQARAVQDAAQAAFDANAFEGFRAGLREFGMEAANVNEQIKSFTKKTLGDMTQAFSDFVATGKLDFNSLAASILVDLQKIATNAIFSRMFGDAVSNFGSGSSGTVDPISGISSGGGGGGLLGSLFGAASGGNLLAALFNKGGTVGRDGTPALVRASQFKNAKKLAGGGPVSGTGKDRVPILASEGEVVLNEGQADVLRRAVSGRSVGRVTTGSGAASMMSGRSGGSPVQANITVVVQGVTDEPSFARNLGKVSSDTAREMNRALARND